MEAEMQFEADDTADEFAEDAGDERGASLVEYALLIALIALICFASITLLGNNASQGLNTAANTLMNAN